MMGTREISCERTGEKEEKSEGCCIREQTYGSMQRMVVLPADVTKKRRESLIFKMVSWKSRSTRQKSPQNHKQQENNALFSPFFPMTFSILFTKICSDG